MRLTRSKVEVLIRRLSSRKPLPIRYPQHIERKIIRLYNSELAHWLKLYDELVYSKFNYLLAQDTRQDSFVDTLGILTADFKARVNSSIAAARLQLNSLSSSLLRWNKTQWNKHISSITRLPIPNNAKANSTIQDVFVSNNSSSLSALASRVTADLNVHTIRNIQNRSVRVKKSSDYVRNIRLAATLNTSQFGSSFFKASSLALGISEYVWRTANDEKVRATHSPLEGKICSWSDSSIFKYPSTAKWLSRSILNAVILHPGEDYHCRCYPEVRLIKLVENA